MRSSSRVCSSSGLARVQQSRIRKLPLIHSETDASDSNPSSALRWWRRSGERNASMSVSVEAPPRRGSDTSRSRQIRSMDAGASASNWS